MHFGGFMIVSTHKGFTLVERADGSVDAVERITGRWINRPTVRAAKWAVTVHANIEERLHLSAIRDNVVNTAAHAVMHSVSISTHRYENPS
jgi:sensor domain CHASE-containing protein